MATNAIDTTLGSISLDRHLQYENYQVLSAIQALCGAITPNMVAVSLKCVGEAVHLYFYLEQDSQIDREEIEDATGELDCLQCTSVPIVAHVEVVGASTLQVAGRVLYRRYQPTAEG